MRNLSALAPAGRAVPARPPAAARNPRCRRRRRTRKRCRPDPRACGRGPAARPAAGVWMISRTGVRGCRGGVQAEAQRRDLGTPCGCLRQACRIAQHAGIGRLKPEDWHTSTRLPSWAVAHNGRRPSTWAPRRANAISRDTVSIGILSVAGRPAALLVALDRTILCFADLQRAALEVLAIDALEGAHRIPSRAFRRSRNRAAARSRDR